MKRVSHLKLNLPDNFYFSKNKNCCNTRFVTSSCKDLGIKDGRFGSCSKKSAPLPTLFSYINKSDRNTLLKIGESTNSDGNAYCFLKNKFSVPLSTSQVHSCSVIYLFNKKTKIHTLYHAYDGSSNENLAYYLSKIVPEGFTHASIVLGDYYADCHAKTTPNIISVLESLSPKSKINLYHCNSKYPEIVGYQGQVFEIKNALYNGSDYLKQDCGQRSFKLVDAFVYKIFDYIDRDYNKWVGFLDKVYSNASEYLEDVMREINPKQYNKYVRKVIDKAYQEKKMSIESAEKLKKQ